MPFATVTPIFSVTLEDIEKAIGQYDLPAWTTTDAETRRTIASYALSLKFNPGVGMAYLLKHLEARTP